MKHLNLRRLWAALALALILALAAPTLLPARWVPGISTARAAGKVKLNKTKATIYNSQSVQLKLKNAKGTVKWKSSNKKVATVNSKGKVTGKKAGTATITATYGKKKYTCKITVKPVLSAKKSITVPTGELFALNCRLYVDGSLTYKVANPNMLVCEWSEEWTDHDTKTKLYMVGLEPGSTTIKLTNSKTKDVVNVKVKVTGEFFPVMSADVGTLALAVGQAQAVTFNVVDGTSLTFDIDNPDIADCQWGAWNENAIPLTVTGKQAGTATVTVTHDVTQQFIEIPVSVSAAASDDSAQPPA